MLYIMERTCFYEECDMPKYDTELTITKNKNGKICKNVIFPKYKDIKVRNKTGSVSDNGCITFCGDNYNNLILIDVDNKNDTINNFHSQIASDDLHTFTLKTCSGGYHYYYRLSKEQREQVPYFASLDAQNRNKSLFNLDIDVKYNNQCGFGMGKVEFENKLYEYSIITKVEPSILPNIIFDEIKRIYEERTEKEEENKEDITYERCTEWDDLDEKEKKQREKKINRILNNVDSGALSYDEWVKIMMAVVNISNNIDAFEWLKKWSKKGDNYCGDEKLKKIINGFKKDNDKKLGMTHLLKYLPETDKDEDEKYLEVKKTVEEKYFYVMKKSKYAYIDDENDITFKSALTVKEELQMYDYDIEVETGKKKKIVTTTQNFYKLWIKDKSRLIYKDIVFNPDLENCDKKNYNEFKGFKYNDDKFIIDNNKFKIIDKIIKNIFKSDNEYIFFMNWVAHIVQKPWQKTNKCIVLQSEIHGMGKNSIVELITNMLTPELTAKINNIDQIDGRFNKVLVHKFFIYGDEINLRAKAKADALKNFVTQTFIRLERKGIDPVMVQCMANLMLTSNHEEFLKIEDSDRRFMLVQINRQDLSKEDFNEFYKFIKTEEGRKTAFNYFKRYNMTIDVVNTPPPLSAYKKTITYQNLPAYKQFIFNDYNNMIGEKLTANKLYEKCIEYAKSHHLTTDFTITKCGAFFTNLGINKIRSSKGQVYSFDEDLQNKIQRNDPEYFKYLYEETEEIEEPKKQKTKNKIVNVF